jgi:CubicO group peptidase (beta-lactamase class C family)
MIHESKIDCPPQDVGYNPEIIARLDTHVEGLINKGTIQAGAYLLAKDGKVFAHRSMGKRSANGDKDDFLPGTLRPTASITKLFTAGGILQLLEQGKLFLHQPVSSIIKEFDTDMHRYITIFHLLTHTSGIKSDPGNFFEPYPEDRDDSWTKENWIKKVLTGPLQFKPGTVWNYCSKGFNILAEIIARVSGMDFDRYIEEHIFKPLGMDSSFFFVPDELKSKVCTISEWNESIVNRKRKEVTILPRLGGGAIISTIADLWKFGQMILNGGTFNGRRVLGRKTVEAATKIQVKEIPAYNWRPHLFDNRYTVTYGLGIEINKHSFLTNGTVDHEGAEGALLFLDPKENFLFAGFFPAVDWHGESWVSPLAIAWSGIE